MNFRIHDVIAPKCISRRIPNATQLTPGVVSLRNHLTGESVNPEIAKPPPTLGKLELLGFIENTRDLALTSFTSGRNEFLLFNSDRTKTFTPAYTSGVGNISIFVVGHGGTNKQDKETWVSVTLRGVTYTLTAKAGKIELPGKGSGGAGGDAILSFEKPDSSKTTIIAAGGAGGEKAEKGLSEEFSNDDILVLLGGGGGGYHHGGGSSYLGGGASNARIPGMTVGHWGGMGCWENTSMINGFGGGVGLHMAADLTKAYGGGGGGAIFALFRNVPAGTVFNLFVPNHPSSGGGPGVVIVDY